MAKQLPMGPEKAICQICNIVHEHGGLALGKIFLDEDQLKEKERLIESTATHFAWCKDCEEKILLGYIALLEFDERLTIGDVPFRTGRMNWIQSYRLREIFNEESYLSGMKLKALYIQMPLFQQIEDLLQGKENDGEPPTENGGFNYSLN